jgi:hypothetical protein
MITVIESIVIALIICGAGIVGFLWAYGWCKSGVI